MAGRTDPKKAGIRPLFWLMSLETVVLVIRSHKFSE